MALYRMGTTGWTISILLVILIISIPTTNCQHDIDDEPQPSVGETQILEITKQQKLLEATIARENDLDKINGDFSKTFVEDLYGPMFQTDLDNKTKTADWFLTFSGPPFDGFLVCVVLLPIIIAHLCLLLLSGNPPVYEVKGYDAKFHSNVPTVPLIYLQQTVLEKVLQRPKRNTLEWFAGKFIVRVSDNLLYLNDLSIPIVPPEAVKNPWKTVRLLNKFNRLYKNAKANPSKRDNDAESSTATDELEVDLNSTIDDFSHQFATASTDDVPTIEDESESQAGPRKTPVKRSRRKNRLNQFVPRPSAMPSRNLDLPDEKESAINSLLDEAQINWEDQLIAENSKDYFPDKSQKGKKTGRNYNTKSSLQIEEEKIERGFGLDPNLSAEIAEIARKQKPEQNRLKKQKLNRKKPLSPEEKKDEPNNPESKPKPRRSRRGLSNPSETETLPTVSEELRVAKSKQVQFHNKAKVRYGHGPLHKEISDRLEPLKTAKKPPEQLESLKSFLKSSAFGRAIPKNFEHDNETTYDPKPKKKK